MTCLGPTPAVPAQVYADATETIIGKPPKEVILLFLHITEPVSMGTNK